MKYKCIIIDDARHSIEILQEHITKMPYLDIFRIYTDPILALHEITLGENVDFIFSAVDMPGIGGIELGKLIRHKTTHFIIIAAHTRFALEAYDIHATNYLLMPINFVKFYNTISLSIAFKIHLPSKKNKEHIIVVKSIGRSSILVQLDNIIYVEINKEILNIVTTEETIKTIKTLKEAEDLLLRDEKFIKIHRSYIVAVKFIKSIDDDTVKMKNGNVIHIGNTFKESLLMSLKKYKF